MAETRELGAPPAPPALDAPRPKPSRGNSVRLRFGTLGQILRMLGRNKRWWLVPMMTILGLLGLVLSGLTAIQYVAPFIYAIF